MGSNECGQIGLGLSAQAVGSVARPLWVPMPVVPWSQGVSPLGAPAFVVQVAAAGCSSFALVGVRAPFARSVFGGGLATPAGVFLGVSPAAGCFARCAA